ncbi:UNVERIFIED_CONTAM: hypothetical protein FKN15_006133 [Acipenser sinensis]
MAATADVRRFNVLRFDWSDKKEVSLSRLDFSRQILQRLLEVKPEDLNCLIKRPGIAVSFDVSFFLNGYANHRLDDLLLLLCRRVMEYYRYLDGLQEAGRLTNQRAEKESTGLRAAEELLQKGWIERCHWMDDYRCLVPSTSRETWWYTVVLPEYTCECVAASNGGLCKHLHIAVEAAKQKGLDVDSMQKRLVQELLQGGKTSQCKDMV